MKKLFKSPPPNELTAYAATYPNNDWDGDFRNHATALQHPGDDFRAIKQRLLADQGGLCGYCEKEIGHLNASLQRVEHYHLKSDTSNPAINWSLMWSNILMVCTGGEKEKAQHPLPVNLSCDAHKNHRLNGLALAGITATLTNQINPLNIPASPSLFAFNMQSGELSPDQATCQVLAQAQGLAPAVVVAKIQSTIDLLNLNCDRLCLDRLKVRNQYNQQVKKARENNDLAFKQHLAQRWFSKRWPSFFTTRRILLGSAAETYLQQIQFQG